MQPLDPTLATAPGLVRDALRGKLGTRSLTFRYERLSSSNALIGALNGVMAGSVENNALADIKRTAKLSVLDGIELDFLKDRIKPYARLAIPETGLTVEWPLGVFLLTSPSRKLTGGAYVTREVQAYDQLLAVRDERVTDRYTIAAGVAYTTAITTLLAGVYMLNLTPSALTLPSAMEWEPGTTKLRILNDLLAAINYESAWFDENGRLVCRPYISPMDRASEWTYATDRESLLAGDIDQSLDLFSIPNKFVLVKSEPDLPPLTGTYTNTSPASPTSTVSRGRTIVQFEVEEDAADQTTIDAKAKRRAFEASQVFEVVEFETAIMPIHSNADVLSLEVDGLGVSAKYAEHSWSYNLRAGSTMKHRVRRVVTI